MGNPNWTDAEKEKLTRLFGVHPNDELAKMLGRSESALFKKAIQLGLSSGHATQGYERINEAARRHGLSHNAMRRIIRWADLHARRILMEPGRGVPDDARVKHRWYDRFAVDEALERWKETETPGEAARRVGVDASVLRKWMREAGIPGEPTGRGRKEWRNAKDVYDRVVVTRVNADNLVSASEEHGIHRTTLSELLRSKRVSKVGDRWVVTPTEMAKLCEGYWRGRLRRLRLIDRAKQYRLRRALKNNERVYGVRPKIEREIERTRARLARLKFLRDARFALEAESKDTLDARRLDIHSTASEAEEIRWRLEQYAAPRKKVAA